MTTLSENTRLKTYWARLKRWKPSYTPINDSFHKNDVGSYNQRWFCKIDVEKLPSKMIFKEPMSRLCTYFAKLPQHLLQWKFFMNRCCCTVVETLFSSSVIMFEEVTFYNNLYFFSWLEVKMLWVEIYSCSFTQIVTEKLSNIFFISIYKLGDNFRNI